VYIRFAWLVLIHKWRVLYRGVWYRVPLWRLLIHDLSKFRPSEFRAYVRYQTANGYAYRCGHDWRYDVAMNHHHKRNPHHWQYWVHIAEDGTVEPLPMPDIYVREMVADWDAAGLAPGRMPVIEWYRQNFDKLLLHTITRDQIDYLLFERNEWHQPAYPPWPSLR
jgi:hypothetical protein